MGSWFWAPLTLTGLQIGTTSAMKVAVELPALTTLLISPACGSLLLEAGETETSFCQIISDGDSSIAGSSRVQPALAVPGPERSTQRGEGSPGESSPLFSSQRVKQQHIAYKGTTLLALRTSQVSKAAKYVGIAAGFEAKIRQTHDFSNCM